MKKPVFILLFGLLLGITAFAGLYCFRMAPHRALMRSPQPELAWLKHEFKLSDAEFARISQLHEAYLPQCQARCATIAAQNEKLEALLSKSSTVTPEIQALLVERAKTRADCEAEMLKHFMAVSQTMPPEQGRRYLSWVEQHCSLHDQAMENMYRAPADHMR